MGSQLNSVNADFVIDATGGSDLVFQQDGVEKGRVGAGGFGKVLQVVNVEDPTYMAIIKGTNNDDTIPQRSEMFDVISAIITPKQIGSKIVVTSALQLSTSSSIFVYNGIFKGSDTSPIGMSIITTAAASHQQVSISEAVITTTSLSPITFYSAVADHTGVHTICINGYSARLLGGVLKSKITVTEIAQ